MSSDVNRVFLRGRIGAPTEFRHTTTGAQVATIRMATSEQWTDDSGQKKEATQWHRVIAWNALAHQAAALQVGQAVTVEGSLVTRSYEAADGGKRWVTEVKALGILPLSAPRKRASSSSSSASSGSSSSTSAPDASDEPEVTHTAGDDDIPF